MKRVFAACGALAISVSLGIAVNVSINNYCDAITRQTQVCLELAEKNDIEALVEASEKFDNMWEEIHGGFALVTSESNIDALEENILPLKTLAEKQEVELYYERCLECINILEIIKENEKITLGNIF